jgi:hypothetical protein
MMEAAGWNAPPEPPAKTGQAASGSEEVFA